MTLGEWIPEYLTAYKLHTIKDNSYYSLELVARHIPQELKDMELEDIRPMHLQRFFNDFAQTASKSYMDKMRVMVNALFETARDNDLCQKNPYSALARSRHACKYYVVHFSFTSGITDTSSLSVLRTKCVSVADTPSYPFTNLYTSSRPAAESVTIFNIKSKSPVI